MAKVKLIDTTKCIACKGCQTACKNWNQLPAQETTFVGSYENPADLDPNTFCRVKFNEYDEGGAIKWYFAKFQCMHCSEPACMGVCPAKAISKTSLGSVKVDQETCIACGLCVTACPFEVPRVGTKMYKCTQCFDRAGNQLTPACAKTCPTGAVSFGDQSAKISEAEDRVAAIKDKYPNAQIYGKEELGGLGTIYVLKDAPDKYGLPADPQVSLSTYFWNVALAPVKTLAAVGLTVGFMHKFVESKAAEKEDNIE